MTHLYTVPNTTAGLDTILVDTIAAAPFITPLLLLFVWGVVFFGGITRQKLRIGSADYPLWSVIASMAMLIIAMLMSVTAGIIRLDWLVLVTVVTIFSGVWLFLDRRQSEV